MEIPNTPSRVKFIENNDLDSISNLLIERPMGCAILNGKLETYSLESIKLRQNDVKGDGKLSFLDGLTAESRSKGIALSTATVHDISSRIEKNALVVSRSNSCSSDNGKYVPPHNPNSLHLAHKEIIPKRQHSDPQEWTLHNRRPRSNSIGDQSFTSMVKTGSSQSYNRRRASSLSDLSEVSSKHILLDIIHTMNESFPDYDFSSTRLSQVVEKDVVTAMQVVNGYLAELNVDTFGSFLERLWKSVDEVINLRRCEVFSYVPDNEEDPFSLGSIWSFNFFFLNRDLNRICFFSCIAVSKYGRRLAASLGAQDDADLLILETEDSEAVHSDDEDDELQVMSSSNRRGVVSITDLNDASDSDEFNE